jgi:hypothetical protein
MIKARHLIIELAMPVALCALAVFVLLDARDMGTEAVFPTMVAAVLLACSIYWIVEILVRQKRVITTEDLNPLKVPMIFAALVVYVLLVRRIGYIAATLLLVGYTVWALGYKNYRALILCSVLTVGAIFFIFKVLLHVPLPLFFFDF